MAAVQKQGPPGHLALVLAIFRKDLVQASREKIYMVLSVVALVMFIVVFWVMPENISNTYSIGMVADGLAEQLDPEAIAEEGIALEFFASAEELEAAVRGQGDRDEPLSLGLVLPPDFMAAGAAGQPVTAALYVNEYTPDEIRLLVPSLLREAGLQLAGEPLPITIENEAGFLQPEGQSGPISLRLRMLPLLVFFVLLMETFSLASLISSEVAGRTVVAVCATPANTADVLAAKSLHGILLSLFQALILLMAVGGLFAGNPAIMLTAILIGAAMFTGIAMIAGSAGKDFLGTLFFTMALVFPMLIPAIGAFFPGSAPLWVRWVPSYGIMQTLIHTTANGAGWAEVGEWLLVSAAWLLVIFVAGWRILGKKAGSL